MSDLYHNRPFEPDCEKWFFDNNSKTVEINITDKIIANGDAVL